MMATKKMPNEAQKNKREDEGEIIVKAIRIGTMGDLVKPIGQIYETYDYSMFARLEDNRKVRATRISKLIASISERYVLNPIIVNERMEVIDGQGRYEALKELGKPIHFIISEGTTIEDCRRMNKYNTKWSRLDFVESMSKTNANYALLLKTHYETGLSLTVIPRLINVATTSKYGELTPFEKGMLVFGQEQYEKVIKINRMCEEIKEALAFSGRLNDAFRISVEIMEKTKGYNHKNMLKRCRENRHSYNQMARIDGQLAEFERIYNKRLRNENKIYFTDYMRNKGYAKMDYSFKNEGDESTLN